MHDLRRALEDAVDAHVAQDLLDRHAAQAAGLQGRGGLVAAAAADLHELVDHAPAHLGAVELGDGGLDAYVVALLVRQPAGHVEHGLEAVSGRGDERDALRRLVVLADRLAPLDALAGELAGDLRRPLARPRHRWPAIAKRPVLSVARAILSPRPSRPITFSAGTKTSVYRVWEFSIPRSPMNSMRCSTTTPSVSLGTMKAVMPPL